jgi:hypothetical protein
MGCMQFPSYSSRSSANTRIGSSADCAGSLDGISSHLIACSPILWTIPFKTPVGLKVIAIHLQRLCRDKAILADRDTGAQIIENIAAGNQWSRFSKDYADHQIRSISQELL